MQLILLNYNIFELYYVILHSIMYVEINYLINMQI